MLEALRNANGRGEKFEVVVRHAAWHVREHPVLRQLAETDAAFLLRTLRDNYRQIREAVGDLVLPFIADTAPVRTGVVTGAELIDWTARLLLSWYLIPDPNPEKLARSMVAFNRMMLELGGTSDASDDGS
jgi:hypothetical protein